jgi:hypothetical protein
MSATAVIPLLALVVVLITAAWVHADARASSDAGTPVVVVVGDLRIEAPEAWLVGCLVLWIVFFPLYLVARRNSL